MKKVVALATILLSGWFSVFGQQTTQQPQTSASAEREKRQTVLQPDPANRQFNRILNGRNRTFSQGSLLQIFQQSIQPLYRELTKEELKTLAPNQADLNKFAVFLRQPNTGITKLAVDMGCGENPSVVDVSAECLKYSMPGAGSSFSFRVNNYRIRRLADLTFTNNSFQTTGKLLHGIIVNIGDVPLEQMSLTTKAAKFLTEFKATQDIKEATEVERKLVAGIENDGLIYRNGVSAKADTTYLLRSIAYRGTFMRAVQNVTYNEFEFDKRRDVLVAFRVVRRDADGSVTIIWKELQDKKSPEIKRNKEAQTDIEENKFVAEKKYN